MMNKTKSYTIEEINAKSRHHKVTHAILKYDIPADIGTLLPHLTHLKLYEVGKIADWLRYGIVIKLYS